MKDKSDDIEAVDASATSSSWVLDKISEPAWNAYKAMSETKQEHFAFIEVLENKKKKFNLSPSQDDTEKLKRLLAEHDKQVRVFTDSTMALKASHPEAHKTLFEYIAQAVHAESENNVQH